MGRLIDLKMVDIAIQAVNICSSPNLKLTIVGDGPAGDALRDLASSLPNSRTEFTGWLPQERVMDYYDMADVFVLPSVRECGGAVVLEAMARGVPVIATGWGGPADYVNEKTGFLITPDSRDSMIHQFARCIDLLAGDPGLRRRLGEAAVQRVKNNFTWEKKIERIIKLYSQVLENRHSVVEKSQHAE